MKNNWLLTALNVDRNYRGLTVRIHDLPQRVVGSNLRKINGGGRKQLLDIHSMFVLNYCFIRQETSR